MYLQDDDKGRPQDEAAARHRTLPVMKAPVRVLVTRSQDDDIDSVCDACESLGESTRSKDSGVGLVILR